MDCKKEAEERIIKEKQEQLINDIISRMKEINDLEKTIKGLKHEIELLNNGQEIIKTGDALSSLSFNNGITLGGM